MKLHPSLTPNLICSAVERRNHSLDNPGFCIKCGTEHEGIEPDARRYDCESCGQPAVYGAEELLFEVF